MAFVIKFVKGVRNHWKKSTFAALAIAYGVKYTKEQNKIESIMRKYCEEARLYGLQTISNVERPRKLIVILNPNANGRKATKNFEKYCAPILHLSGICIDVIQTKSEGHARTIIEELNDTVDGIVVAAGDGTLSEVVTGLLRRADNNFMLEKCPIGVIPLGKTNNFSQSLIQNTENNKNVREVKNMTESALNVVKENVKQTSVMHIQIIPEENSEKSKPVFALTSLEWGAIEDAIFKKDKYWYFGPLRKYVTYIFNGYKNALNWNCEADIKYTPPCVGCQSCKKTTKFLIEDLQNNFGKKQQKNNNTRWWSTFLPAKKSTQEVSNDYLEFNELCDNLEEKQIETTDFSLKVCLQEKIPQLLLNLGPSVSNVSYVDFVTNGFNYELTKERYFVDNYRLKSIEIIPRIMKKSEDIFFYIDNEQYEVKPVKITLLPNILKVFCSKNNQ